MNLINLLFSRKPFSEILLTNASNALINPVFITIQILSVLLKKLYRKKISLIDYQFSRYPTYSLSLDKVNSLRYHLYMTEFRLI